MVADELRSAENGFIVALLIGTHRKVNGALFQPFSLEESLGGGGYGDHRIGLGGLLGSLGDDDLALNQRSHLRLEALGSRGDRVIDIELFDVEDAGQRHRLGAPLNTRAVQTDGNIVP